eukprot:c23433_g7_i1 orf=1-303(-)
MEFEVWRSVFPLAVGIVPTGRGTCQVLPPYQVPSSLSFLTVVAVAREQGALSRQCSNVQHSHTCCLSTRDFLTGSFRRPKNLNANTFNLHSSLRILIRILP